jgi:hypothetical protein
MCSAMTVKVFCIAIYLPNIKYMIGKAMGIDLGFSGIYISILKSFFLLMVLTGYLPQNPL